MKQLVELKRSNLDLSKQVEEPKLWNDELKADIRMLKDIPSNTPRDFQSGSNIETMYAKLNDCTNRSYNIIIYGLDENNSHSIQQRSDEHKQTVTSILHEIIDLKEDVYRTKIGEFK